MATDKDLAVSNIFFNFIAPYYSSSRVGGALVNAGVGVLNEWIVRWLLKRRIPLTQLGMAHVLAEPFTGVTGYFKTGAADKAKLVESFTSGARQGVAVLFGHWLVDILNNGFKLGLPSFMFVLIVLGSKALSKTEIGFMLQYVPKTLANQYMTFDEQLQKLEKHSNLQMAAKSGDS
jgi:hypothetical protein